MTFHIGLVYSSREIMTIGKGLFKRKIIYIMFLLNRKNRRKQRKYGEYAGVVLNIKNIVYFYEKIAVKKHSSTEEKCWNSKGYI